MIQLTGMVLANCVIRLLLNQFVVLCTLSSHVYSENQTDTADHLILVGKTSWVRDEHRDAIQM